MDYTDIPEEYLEDGIDVEITAAETVVTNNGGTTVLDALLKDPVVMIVGLGGTALIVLLLLIAKILKNRGNKIKSQAMLRKENETADLKQQRKLQKQQEQSEKNKKRRASGIPVNTETEPANNTAIPVKKENTAPAFKNKKNSKRDKKNKTQQAANLETEQSMSAQSQVNEGFTLDLAASETQQGEFDLFFEGFTAEVEHDGNLEDEAFFNGTTEEQAYKEQAHLAVHNETIDKESTSERLKRRTTAAIKDDERTTLMEQAVLLDSIQQNTDTTLDTLFEKPIEKKTVSGIMQQVKDVREDGEIFEEDPFFGEETINTREMNVIETEPEVKAFELDLDVDVDDTFSEDESLNGVALDDFCVIEDDSEIKEEPLDANEESEKSGIISLEKEPAEINVDNSHGFEMAKGSDLGTLKLMEKGITLELPKTLEVGQEYVLVSNVQYEMYFDVKSTTKSLGLNCSLDCDVAKVNDFDSEKRVIIKLVPHENITLDTIKAKMFTNLSKIAYGEVTLELTVMFN